MQLKKQCKAAVTTSEENDFSAGGNRACFIKSSYLFHLNYKRDSLVCIHACSDCVSGTCNRIESRQHLKADTITSASL